jgi:peptide-methionine (R)-S-oxide reductase
VSVRRSEAEWKKVLSDEQFRVFRLGAVERAFTADYLEVPKDGTYYCVACGQALFRAANQFDAGTGWPSFTEPVTSDAVQVSPRRWNGKPVRCRNCEGHLGLLFTDGPAPSHRRYSIYSVTLKWEPLGS